MEWILPGGVGILILFIGGIIVFFNRSKEVTIAEFPGLVENFVIFFFASIFLLGVFASLREWFSSM